MRENKFSVDKKSRTEKMSVTTSDMILQKEIKKLLENETWFIAGVKKLMDKNASEKPEIR